MGEAELIREQIQRMRKRRVEPYEVCLDDALFSKLGRPRKVAGVAVDCGGKLAGGWRVR